MQTPTHAKYSNLPPSLLPDLNNSGPTNHRALSIPPSPRTLPPHPPNSLPASDSVGQVRDLDFPSPPTFAPPSSASSLVAGATERLPNMLPPSPRSRRLPHLPVSFEASLSQKPTSVAGVVVEHRPPAIPPRSKLRPPPVKIITEFRQMAHIPNEVARRRTVLPLNLASPAHSHSSSVSSSTISPLSTPPMHSHSSSVASIMEPHKPALPQHAHSSSISSSFVISPMPTPPPLSPASPSSTIQSAFSPPYARPVTPEPRIDMDVLRRLIFEDGEDGHNSIGSDSEPESEIGASLKAIVRAHKCGGDEHEDSSTGTTTVAEFAWQEEPRAPPSRMSFYEPPSPERIHRSSDVEDDDGISIYSQFSSAYTFRSRSNSTRRRRSVSVRRSGKKGRMNRHVATTSMMSVYSQASFSSRDTMDLLSVPTMPCSSGGSDGIAEDLLDNDLGEMVFEAPEYAYAFSWDDYVGHGLEGVALAGRTPTRSGADFEAQLPFSRHAGKPDLSTLPDDCRSLLTGSDEVKSKRRTSSNISVIGNIIPTIQDPEVGTSTGPALTDVSSLVTNGSIGDVSTTSTWPMSPRALVPNRRQRTIRRVATALPSSHPQPSSVSVAVVGPEDKISQGQSVRSGLRGMRNRVSVLKSRLVSLTLPSSRSPPSPTFLRGHAPESYDGLLTPSSAPCFATGPSSGGQWPPPPVSPSMASSSSSDGSASAAYTSFPSSPSSLWTTGVTNGDALFLSPTVTRAPFSTAV
ncbi:hypothetical protein B0H19DRAFT_1127348 [Mycena capillaripes]|nr:hypothetical protein B0H19DRAFT_1127348 [Mycena capillaripes]